MRLAHHELVRAHARSAPESIAIMAAARKPLTYGRLYHHICAVVQTLNSLGLGRNDRIAIVLNNGPEMAVAFMAVGAGATCAPLNPAYKAEEFEFYLSDLNAKAVIVEQGSDSPVTTVAKQHGVAIIELLPDLTAEAGIFTLSGGEQTRVDEGGLTLPEDLALVLHTSGTTSRPKIVPLTHANISISALNIRTTLDLATGDRCLNVMPLFHIHGLIGALLATLTAGASIVCTPGFQAARFFEWLDEFRPTWYTAVPTIHQAILMRAGSNGETIGRRGLRFIRSCSSGLPPKIMAELEDVFGVPVIEAYGMTEAAHQVASNPLPPHTRKSGSVGKAAGAEFGLMDDAGSLVQPNQTGEIVIRGSTVMSGYENNRLANTSAFTNSWFRTGDQGFVDDDGYLFITGRLKEIINRGGEKIAPIEIDRVLLDHPAVAEAVAFAVPDARLGEEVAAAIVLREGKIVTEAAIQEFAAKRLADFKVPKKVLILEHIPRGGTGKIQRVGMAGRLSLEACNVDSPKECARLDGPRNPIEEKLLEVLTDVLEVKVVKIDDNFLQLGGDSVIATRLVARLRKLFEVDLTIINVFQCPTAAGLAEVIASLLAEPRDAAPHLIHERAGLTKD